MGTSAGACFGTHRLSDACSDFRLCKSRTGTRDAERNEDVMAGLSESVDTSKYGSGATSEEAAFSML